MPRVTVHETPGIIDLRSFTTFGLNSKPRSESPFGFFGTGLKYSVAVLARLGISVYVMTDGNVYSFWGEDTEFRDKNFRLVRMRRENRRVQPLETTFSDLPYTTELGKTWELWQVYRELHSNTLDEKGYTLVYDSEEVFHPREGDWSCVVVVGDEYAAIATNDDDIFLPEGLREADCSTNDIQVLEAPSNHVYYRGVRVLDLTKPSRLTYNFVSPIDLTEDRTAKNPYALEAAIKRKILGSMDESIVEAVVSADPDSWEGQFDYDYSGSPSQTFLRAAQVAARPAPGAVRLVRASEPRRRVENPLKRHPRPWRVAAGRPRVIFDAEGREVMTVSEDVDLYGLNYIMFLLGRTPDQYEMENFLDVLERQGHDAILSDNFFDDQAVPF